MIVLEFVIEGGTMIAGVVVVVVVYCNTKKYCSQEPIGK
jgi:hypothetical protein